MIDYKNDLNEEQLAVVYQGDGRCLVLAGAGSGKTRTITYRVAYLLEQGINADRIMLVTFTNKAAKEMVSRVRQLTGANQDLPWAGTFHHIAYKILRPNAGVIGYAPNFTILDSADSESLIKNCIKSLSVNTAQERFPSAKVVQNIISYTRNAETIIDDVLSLKYPGWLKWADQIKEIADDYDKRKKTSNAMDFDDLLSNLLLLLNDQKFISKYAGQFKYVLVDEYQDTNRIQASIIKKLASVHNNLLVVGDDAQSIYSFRAADIENILNFENDYADAKIFKLETNYRSSGEILSLANAVIANNINQYQKELKTVFESGAKPELCPQSDEEAEADYVVNKISGFITAGIEPYEIAVLFRASHHSQRLELALVKAGIPYDYRGGVRFFERAHIKDILAYLRIMNNLADESAWRRVLLKEDGIGPVAVERIIGAIRAVQNVSEIKMLGYDILGEKAKIGWQNFSRIWDELLSVGASRPAELVKTILETGYGDYLETEYLDSNERMGDLDQLVVYASKFSDLGEFLAEANLTEDYGQKMQISKVPSEKKIILSTVHQAKGLEWSAVFLINLTSGGFPNSRALSENGGLEEERRLFYVALTRAKKHLFLTYPMESGSWGDIASGPSMFLEEIDSELFDDKSLLKNSRALALNDLSAGIEYIDEEDFIKIKPGSFLRDINDL